MISRRALFAGALIPLPRGAQSTQPLQTQIDYCARQLLCDAREARLIVTYDKDQNLFRFADEPGPARTEAEEDTAFFVKWGLKVRPLLREAVVSLLAGTA